MAEWIEFSETYVLGAMPSDVATAYGAWLTAHPAKAGRIGEIVGQVLTDFRTGLSANPNVPMDEDETKLEIRCEPHALASVVCHLMITNWQFAVGSWQWVVGNGQLEKRRNGKRECRRMLNAPVHCKLQTANCQLQTANCKLPTANWNGAVIGPISNSRAARTILIRCSKPKQKTLLKPFGNSR